MASKKRWNDKNLCVKSERVLLLKGRGELKFNVSSHLVRGIKFILFSSKRINGLIMPTHIQPNRSEMRTKFSRLQTNKYIFDKNLCLNNMFCYAVALVIETFHPPTNNIENSIMLQSALILIEKFTDAFFVSSPQTLFTLLPLILTISLPISEKHFTVSRFLHYKQYF